MKNKKGISAVVATVLIILITVAAVTIIWAAIIPMITNQISGGTVCMEAVSQVQLRDSGYTCKNSGTSSCNVLTCGVDNDEACTTRADCVAEVVAEVGGTWTTGNNISIQIGRLEKTFDLADVQVLVSSGGTTSSFDLSNVNTTVSPSPVVFPGANEEKVYIIDMGSLTGINKVEIAPIVKIGNTKETCGASSEKVLLEC